MLRLLQDLLVEFVLAGALTGLALGHVLVGLVLLAVGVGLLRVYLRRRRVLPGDGTSNLSATGL